MLKRARRLIALIRSTINKGKEALVLKRARSLVALRMMLAMLVGLEPSKIPPIHIMPVGAIRSLKTLHIFVKGRTSRQQVDLSKASRSTLVQLAAMLACKKDHTLTVSWGLKQTS